MKIFGINARTLGLIVLVIAVVYTFFGKREYFVTAPECQGVESGTKVHTAAGNAVTC